MGCRREWEEGLHRAGVCVCVRERESECVVGEHGHYADFPFFFQDIRRILSFTSPFPSDRQSSATYAAHFYATARVVNGTEIWESGQLWMVAC